MKSTAIFELTGKITDPGFRPNVWMLAADHGLGGWIADTPNGAHLELTGENENIDAFIQYLQKKFSALYHIRKISLEQQIMLPNDAPVPPFRLIGPDLYTDRPSANMAPCPDCLKKMRDPNSRFYRYPFLSCPKCGPRYSVMLNAPFTRRNTSFLAFPPCPDCTKSIKKALLGDIDGNPLESCSKCGPQLFLADPNGPVQADDPMLEAAKQLRQGKILGIKTFNGFLILCDPNSEEALNTLCKRVGIRNPPISFLMHDMEGVRKYCECSEKEEQLLTSRTAPVLLLRLIPGTILHPEIHMPEHPSFAAVQLPSTAILTLLMESLPEPFDILTCFGGPHPTDPMDAGGTDDVAKVLKIADLLLTHDLKIWGHTGPSIMAVSKDNVPLIIRRSDGMCPLPIRTEPLNRTVLAFGTDAMACTAIGFRESIFQSHCMGAIQTPQSSFGLAKTVRQMLMMFAKVPDMLVCSSDLHTFSAQIASIMADNLHLPLVAVQQHQAIALAGLAEHHLDHALALVLDRNAPGPDGSLWNSELLEITPVSATRLGTFILNARDTNVPADLLECAAELVGIHKESLASLEFRTIFQFYGYLALPAERLPEAKRREYFPYQLSPRNDIAAIDWTPFLFRKPEYSGEKPANLALAFLESEADAAAELVKQALGKTSCRDILLSGKMFLLPQFTAMVEERLRTLGLRTFRHEKTSPDISSASIGQAFFGGMC